MNNLPCFIAHRGYPALYPENSLPGIQAAIQAGARYVEIDIQLSYERTPYLCHDDNLQRLTGQDICLTKLKDDAIDTLTIPYPDSIKYASIPRLATFCQHLAQYPQVTAFIEIKSESIIQFGLAQTVKAILSTIEIVRAQCVLIAFDWEAIALIKSYQIHKVGWIIESWTTAQFSIAMRLQPDYLFCNIHYLPKNLDQLWPGSWQWVIYTVDDYNTALNYAKAGITLIETDTIGTLLTS